MENNPFAKSSDVNTVVFQEPRVENVVKLPLAPLGEAPSITKALEEFKLAVNKLAVPTEAEIAESERKMILMGYGSDEGNIPKSHHYWSIKP